MLNPTIAKLTETAWHLAQIQIEGVEDYVGFSNADKNIGAHLAAVVEADPSDMDSIVTLAALVGMKYQRQTLGLVGADMLAEFKKLGKGGKVTPEQRAKARLSVVAQADEHPKFGKRVLLSFQFNQDFSYALKENGARPFYGPDGWKWAVRPEILEDCVAALKKHGARIVGNLDLSGIVPKADTQRVIHARLSDNKRSVFMSFDYDAVVLEAVKVIPSRQYQGPPTKEWRISSKHLGYAIDTLKNCRADVDVTELEALVSEVPHTSRPSNSPEPEVYLDEKLLEGAYDHQVEGIKWLIAPLTEARKSIVGGSTIRGKILGDKMGLGKTMQTEIASKALLDSLQKSDARVLVIAPASFKHGWQREINKFCGQDETVNIMDGENGPDLSCRWNIVNYDLLDKWYDALVAMGYDILIMDEAHYIKNREAERSRLCVGGKVSMPVPLTAGELTRLQEAHEKKVAEAKADHARLLAKCEREGSQVIPRYKAPVFKLPRKVVQVAGLCAEAKFRVFPLTGTPLANRPKDLFNLLKAIGHPLGKNYRQFAMSYCAPVAKKVGKRVYTEFSGSSNLADLRKKIDPVFLQRFEVPGLPPLMWDWLPVEVDLKAYKAVIADYDARRKAGELSSEFSHLALLSEARICAAVAKIQATIENVENALEQDEKVIVFSNYTQCIAKMKEHFGDKAVVLDGSVSSKINKKTGTSPRQEAIDRFQNDSTCTVFLGQTLAAGVAITLTAATQVRFNDLDWVPANLVQAMKRAHRIGQFNTVNVLFIVAAGTFDEELMSLLEDKLGDVNEFEGTDESLFMNLVERLNTEAPKNLGAKAIRDSREKGLSAAA